MRNKRFGSSIRKDASATYTVDNPSMRFDQICLQITYSRDQESGKDAQE